MKLLLRLVVTALGAIRGTTIAGGAGFAGLGVAIFGTGDDRIGGLVLFAVWVLAVHIVEGSRINAGARVAAAKASNVGSVASGLNGLLQSFTEGSMPGPMLAPTGATDAKPAG